MSHNNGTYYVRLDVESVRDTQLMDPQPGAALLL